MNLAFVLEAFPDAEGIIWHKSIRMITPDTFEMTIISSEYWLEDFAAPESFKAFLWWRKRRKKTEFGRGKRRDSRGAKLGVLEYSCILGNVDTAYAEQGLW